MLRGATKPDRKEKEIETTKIIRESLGKDFVAKLKSNRRKEFGSEYRKEQGKGDASFRRYMAKKMK